MCTFNLKHQGRVAGLATAAAVLAACGGSSVEGRYVARGEALYDSLTFGAEGRVEVVFIGTPSQGRYAIDGDAITVTAPNGDQVLFTVDADDCLTHFLVGTYCRGGSLANVGGAAAPSSGGARGGSEIYAALTDQGRITLELLTEDQARMTMRPNSLGAAGMPAQMSIDVAYERDGNDLVVALPGEEPMQLVRDGRDYVAEMNGETARFIRQ